MISPKPDVEQKVDHLLEELLACNGMFLVTVHNKRVVKVQKVLKPVTPDKVESVRLSKF